MKHRYACADELRYGAPKEYEDDGCAVKDVLSRVRISEVYTVLTGITPRRTGPHTWRASAAWRGGDGQDSVAGDDSRGVWHDFVTDDGGGVLDLVTRAQGGSRADALRWVADYAGVPLHDRQRFPEERRKWAQERQRVEQHLPNARYWQRGAVRSIGESLAVLKAGLVDPTLPWPEVNEIYETERILGRLQKLAGVELVTEYLGYNARFSELAASLADDGRVQELVDETSLRAYLAMLTAEDIRL